MIIGTTLEFIEQQRNILEILTSEKQHVSAKVLTPIDLASLLVLINGNLPAHTKVIGDDDNEKLTAIYKTASYETLVTKDTIAAITHIPLIDDQAFRCAKLTPIPTSQNGELFIPQTKNEFIFENEHSIYLSNQHEMGNCIKYKENNYCETLKPLMNREINNCEWQCFANYSAKQCNFEKIKVDEYWKEIKTNGWIFSVLKETELKIECEANEKYEIMINNSGIIEFDDTCNIHTKLNTVKGRTMLKKK